jgi:hypothetical protein
VLRPRGRVGGREGVSEQGGQGGRELGPHRCISTSARTQLMSVRTRSGPREREAG